MNRHVETHTARRHRVPYALVLVTGAVMGCATSSDNDPAHRPATAEPHALQALRLVIGQRPVQWLSPRASCVVPYDAPDADGCAAHTATALPADAYKNLRSLIPVPTSELSFIRCARVSREIPDGDSVLVAVTSWSKSLVNDSMVRQAAWVWFRRGKRGETVWPVIDPNSEGAQTAAPTTEGQC